MRQNPRLEPPQSSPAIALHPILSNALASLDMQLEDELARYRRQRIGGRRTVRQPDRPRSSESLNLIAIAATSSGHSDAVQPVPVLDERLADGAGTSIAPDAYKPIPAFTANPQPFEGAIALRAPQSLPPDGNTATAPSHGDAHALASAANPNLDDYLESSEELLRSLAEEQAEVQAERHFMQSLLTPLGLGAMLLLLLSSAMFGYVIMNPSSLPWLTAKQSNDAAGSLGQSAGQAVITPPQPDLAKRELPDLNLNNLGTVNVNPGKASPTAPGTQTALKPSSKPTVDATKVAPVSSQPSSESTTPSSSPLSAATSDSSRSYNRTTEPPQAAPRSVPAQPSVAPSVRRAAPTAPASTANGQSSGGASGSYQYKVGIPFENDQTLENARKVVPDAFVRTLPDGRTIVQVGAARDEAEGKVNVQKLRDQGLSSTEVYRR